MAQTFENRAILLTFSLASQMHTIIDLFMPAEFEIAEYLLEFGL